MALLGLFANALTACAQLEDLEEDERIPAKPASMMMQPTPLLEPRINVAEDSRTDSSDATASRLRGTTANAGAANRTGAEPLTFTSKDVISGRESLPLSRDRLHHF